MRIYLAAPLFSQSEREYNKKLQKILESKGFEVFLPQELGEENYEEIFSELIENLEKCDMVIAVLDGTQVDDGVAFECGYAYSKGIPIVGLRTDFRRVGEHVLEINLMLKFSCKKLCRSIDELLEFLQVFQYGKN